MEIFYSKFLNCTKVVYKTYRKLLRWEKKVLENKAEMDASARRNRRIGSAML